MATKPLFTTNLMPDDARTTMYQEIDAWNNIADALTKLTDQEKTMRVALFEKYFQSDPKLKEGTNHIDIGFGKQLTADYRINRRVDDAQLDAALAMGLIERSLVDELIAYKPTLKIGDWKSAPPETRKLFADIITEAPGTPGLKITAPKR